MKYLAFMFLIGACLVVLTVFFSICYIVVNIVYFGTSKILRWLRLDNKVYIDEVYINTEGDEKDAGN